jgi:hypothetical protein
MDGMQYLAGDASKNLFDHLVMAVRALTEPNDEVVLPSWTEPYAWRRTYKVYRFLKQRQANKPPEMPDPFVSNFAASWTAYIRNRQEFLQLIRRDEINNTDALFFGLQPHDLDEPTVNNPDEVARVGIARHPEWRSRAARVETALAKWEGMSAAEKAAVPQIMLARRAVARTKELEQRLSTLESISNNKEISL